MNKQMRKAVYLSISVLSAILLIACLAAPVARAQHVTAKILEGKVLGSGDAPLSGAIVYLQDSKTNSIRTFISIDDGSYRFGQLSPDTDYTVWAKYKNEKSPTKPISSYDSRTHVIIDLHIKTK